MGEGNFLWLCTINQFILLCLTDVIFPSFVILKTPCPLLLILLIVPSYHSPYSFNLLKDGTTSKAEGKLSV